MHRATRAILFAPPPETAHNIVLSALAGAGRSRALCALIKRLHRAPQVPHTVMGISFPNVVGLAAGFDKHARAHNALHALGFGWLELGTVTPQPQPGNPRPRIFRLPQHRALINRMGFNSDGLARFVKNIARADPHIITGINIGKNAATALGDAADDFIAGLDAVHTFADYVALNISSPNTRNLRALQDEDALDPLLEKLNRRRCQLADAHGRRVPLVLKIAPDLEASALDDIAALARKHHIDGIAATNTTTARAGVEAHALSGEVGGLSGAPLASAATDVIRHLFGNLQGEIPIIGIGGIDCAEDALEKLSAGAELVQLYTGFIYHGPKLIRDILTRVAADANGREMRAFLHATRAG